MQHLIAKFKGKGSLEAQVNALLKAVPEGTTFAMGLSRTDAEGVVALVIYVNIPNVEEAA